MSDKQTPGNTAPVEDVGAEMEHRFRYQAAWAATLACALLDEPADFVEVFCEHHEDILLKQVDGRFQGIQVKTRQLAGSHWKTGDEEVFKSLCRFIILDATFPNQFAGFVFATNHFFFTANTGNSFPYILEEASKVNDPANGPPTIRRLIRKLSKTTGRNQAEVLRTLQKTKCTAKLPKFDDSQKVLRETIIRNYSPAKEAVLPTLLMIDSPTKNITRDEDPELVDALYHRIYDLAQDFSKELQLVLIDSHLVEPKDPEFTFNQRRMPPPLISYYTGP